MEGLGSSPLTRGKHRHAPCLRDISGLIPAHAGKTASTHATTRSTQAHPRSRGENAVSFEPSESRKGSSPLTRGKRTRDLLETIGVGLIPAHAGKTARPVRRKGLRWAHPRSRGENHWQEWALAQIPGSSPLTRGKPLHTRLCRGVHRLIPAHAGKTHAGCGWHDYRQAHPRSRGENWGRLVALAFECGSSPLTRGKRAGPSIAGAQLRLIPAHAGKTHAAATRTDHRQAHPRSRGENPCHSA